MKSLNRKSESSFHLFNTCTFHWSSIKGTENVLLSSADCSVFMIFIVFEAVYQSLVSCFDAGLFSYFYLFLLWKRTCPSKLAAHWGSVIEKKWLKRSMVGDVKIRSFSLLKHILGTCWNFLNKAVLTCTHSVIFQDCARLWLLLKINTVMLSNDVCGKKIIHKICLVHGLELWTVKIIPGCKPALFVKIC